MNCSNHIEMVIKPYEVPQIIDFAYNTIQDNNLFIDLADDIGYFNLKEMDIRRHGGHQNGLWLGCPAGKEVLGIRANGDIYGCLSIRDEQFREGNIRDMPTRQLWTRPGAFSWNRNLSREQLTGFCGKCQYGSFCLGGCTGAKLTLNKNIYENNYCLFKIFIEKEKENICKITSIDTIISKAKKHLDSEEYQMSELCLSRARTLDRNNIEVIELADSLNNLMNGIL